MKDSSISYFSPDALLKIGTKPRGRHSHDRFFPPFTIMSMTDPIGKVIRNDGVGHCEMYTLFLFLIIAAMREVISAGAAMLSDCVVVMKENEGEGRSER